MGGPIEAVLVALLVGIFTLLGGWLSGWQERKRAREAAREAREARKEEMLYEKQWEVLEEAVETLTLVNENHWDSILTIAESYFETQDTLTQEESMKSAVKQMQSHVLGARSIELGPGRTKQLRARISTYLPLKSWGAYQRYGELSIEISREVMSTLRGGAKVDVKQVKERLNETYRIAVVEMRKHLGL